MKVADMHCDTIAEIYAKRQAGEECGILKNNLHIDLEKMERGDYAVQNFAVFAHMENLKGKMPLPEYALRLIDTFSQSSADIRPDRDRKKLPGH